MTKELTARGLVPLIEWANERLASGGLELRGVDSQVAMLRGTYDPRFAMIYASHLPGIRAIVGCRGTEIVIARQIWEPLPMDHPEIRAFIAATGEEGEWRIEADFTARRAKSWATESRVDPSELANLAARLLNH